MTPIQVLPSKQGKNFRALRKATLSPEDKLGEFFQEVGFALLPTHDVQVFFQEFFVSQQVYVLHGDAFKKLVAVDWHDYKVSALRGVYQGKFVVFLNRQVVGKGVLQLALANRSLHTCERCA